MEIQYFDPPSAGRSEAASLFQRLMDGPLRFDAKDRPETTGPVGPWSLRGQIGRGGISAVYDAVRRTTSGTQRGALKLATQSGREAYALFAHEALLLRRLASSSVARLLDAGTHTAGLPFLATEFVVGERITRYARTKPLRERLDAACRMCHAVAHLHEHRVVHADLKPEHILVRPNGSVVVLDLGLAHDLESAARPLRGGLTPEFAAPEQVLGEAVSPATDVYALGLIVHEVVTGRRQGVPWALGGGQPCSLGRHGGADRDLPWSSVDWEVLTVVQTAVQAVPSHRFATAAALAQALSEVLDIVASGPLAA